MSTKPANPSARRGGRRRRGFTLAEVLISSAILSLVFVALLAAFGHGSLVVQRGEEVTVATFLAEEVRDMAIQMDFSDIFLLHQETFDPAILSTGESQSRTEYAQSVVVMPLDSATLALTSPMTADAALLAVTVTCRGEPVVTQFFHVFDLSGVQYVEE